MWLNTAHLHTEGETKALKSRYAGPLKILEMTGASAAKLALPRPMLIHSVFRASLLQPFVPFAALTA